MKYQVLLDGCEMCENLRTYFQLFQVLIEWYTAIRSAKLNRLRIAYPGAPEREVSAVCVRKKTLFSVHTSPRLCY